MPQRSFLAPLALVSLFLACMPWLYILAFKWPVNGDLLFYATILKHFSTQFWSGDLYPRWLTDMNDGMGSPVFLFYDPLAFYVASVFQFLSPLDPNGFARVVLILALGLCVSGITATRWLALTYGREKAERGALLYMGMLYLITFVHTGISLSQVWAAAWFPLLLAAADGVVKKGWRGVPFLSAAYALLCFTHMPMTVVFSPIPLLYVLWFSPPPMRRNHTLLAAGAYVLALALAAIRLLPALENTQYITLSGYLGGRLNYSVNFLNPRALAGLGLVLVPLGLLCLTGKRPQLTREYQFWLGIIALFTFMNLPLSKPLWDTIYPLQFLQFPFRYILGMLPPLVFIACDRLPQVARKTHYAIAALMLLVFAAGTPGFTVFFQTYDNRVPVAKRLDMSLNTMPEYTTRWMREAGIRVNTEAVGTLPKLAPVTFVQGQGQVSMQQEPRRVTLTADIDSRSAIVMLRRFYYPAWELPPDMTLEEPRHGMLTLHLPEGHHVFVLEQPWFDGEFEGFLISLAGFAVLAGLFIAARRNQTI